MDTKETRFFRFELDDFFTEDECKEHIQFAEGQGFEEALIQTRNAGQVMNKDVRDNDRVVIERPKFAAQLFERMEEYLPEEIQDRNHKDVTWKLFGLNERFRYYRYQFGQQFKLHPDGHFKRSDNEISFVTVLIYLNDDFLGGETEFVMPHLVVPPKAGKLFLFRHNQLHKGNPVPKGIKYVLRTDAMYRNDI